MRFSTISSPIRMTRHKTVYTLNLCKATCDGDVTSETKLMWLLFLGFYHNVMDISTLYYWGWAIRTTVNHARSKSTPAMIAWLDIRLNWTDNNPLLTICWAISQYRRQSNRGRRLWLWSWPPRGSWTWRNRIWVHHSMSALLWIALSSSAASGYQSLKHIKCKNIKSTTMIYSDILSLHSQSRLMRTGWS